MGNFLDSPKTEKTTEYFESHTGIKVGATGMQGWRIEMEDAHIATNMPTRPDHMFLAVFDGHGGSGAAHYAEKHMVAHIERTEQWKAYLATDAKDLALLGDALIQAFHDIDEALRAHQETTSGIDTSGCTSVTAMVTPSHVICANAGDSRCVLGSNSKSVAMSEDHKPTDENEKRRIENAGGSVQWKRVDGDLAVSRALGDFQYKTNRELPAKDQKVTYLPDIRVHERTAEDDVLILACDGLWDVMTNDEAIDYLRKLFESGEESVKLIAEEMVDTALNKGSRDNISSVVAILSGAKFGPSSNGGVARIRQLRGDRGDSRPESDVPSSDLAPPRDA